MTLTVRDADVVRQLLDLATSGNFEIDFLNRKWFIDRYEGTYTGTCIFTFWLRELTPLSTGDAFARNGECFQRGYIKTDEGLRSETDTEFRERILKGDRVTPGLASDK